MPSRKHHSSLDPHLGVASPDGPSSTYPTKHGILITVHSVSPHSPSLSNVHIDSNLPLLTTVLLCSADRCHILMFFLSALTYFLNIVFYYYPLLPLSLNILRYATLKLPVPVMLVCDPLISPPLPIPCRFSGTTDLRARMAASRPRSPDLTPLASTTYQLGRRLCTTECTAGHNNARDWHGRQLCLEMQLCKVHFSVWRGK